MPSKPSSAFSDDGSFNSDDFSDALTVSVASNSAANDNEEAMRELLVVTYNQIMDSCHQSGIPAPEFGLPEVAVTGSQEDYARFMDTDPETRVQAFGPKITDFDEVMRQLTSRQGNEIIDDAIVLYIYSTNCLDLTLHDLPGIIRIPIPGQPADIAAVTQQISKKYIEKQSTIILAVTAANSEQQESAAQFMALQVDPTGDRTLHVFTKLDMLSPREETIISEYLNNKYNTKYGAVGVVCRSQEDIENNTDVHACLRKESSVLQEKFPNIANQHGTSILRTKIHEILLNQLRARLPHVSSKMEQKINAYKHTLKQLGDVDKRPRMSQIFEVVHKFSNLFSKTISGDKIPKTGVGLVGGAKVVEIFREKFAREVCSIEEPALTPEFMEQVKIAIKNCAGAAPGMFASNNTFPHFLEPEIDKMIAPIMHCVKQIDDLLKSFIVDVESEMELEKARFPSLVGKVIELALSYKTARFNFTEEQLRTFLEVERSYFTFTNLDLDQYYDRSQEMLNQFYHVAPEKPQIQPKADKPILLSRTVDKMQKDAECKVVTMMLAAIELTRKLVLDHVPKRIMYHFVNHLKDNFEMHLVDCLNQLQQGALEELVAEPQPVRTKRTELERKIEALSNARQRLSQHHGFP